MISCAPLNPLGTAVRLAQGDNAGASGVNWKLPGTTCRRPAAFATRSNDPAGTRYAKTWARITIPKRITSVCGTWNRLFVTIGLFFPHSCPFSQAEGWRSTKTGDSIMRARAPAISAMDSFLLSPTV